MNSTSWALGALHPTNVSAGEVVGAAAVAIALMAAMAWMAVRRTEIFVTVPLFSAALLPLINVHGHPADYGVLGAWLLVASVMIVRRRISVVSVVARDLLGIAALGVLIVAAAASALHSHAFGALSVCFRFASYAEVIVLARSFDDSSLRTVRRLVYVAAATLAISVYVQRLGYLHSVMPPYHDPEAISARYGGLIGHPNFAAYTLLAAVLVALIDNALAAPWKAAFIVVSLPAAVSSGARTASVMFVLAVMITAVLAGKRVLVYALPVAILALALGGVVLQRLRFLTHSGGLTGHNAGGWRIAQWHEDFAFHAWYSPVGIGWNRTKDLSVDHAAAHSGYVQILSELGLIGVVGFLLLLAYAVLLGRQAGWRRSAALLAFLAVCNIVDPVILYPATAYAWLLLLLSMIDAPFQLPYAKSSVELHRALNA